MISSKEFEVLKEEELGKNLYIIFFDVVNKKDDVLASGPSNIILKKYNDLTEEYERMGYFMVKEEQIGKNTYIRQFATKTGGYLFDLITAGGIATNITF